MQSNTYQGKISEFFLFHALGENPTFFWLKEVEFTTYCEEGHFVDDLMITGTIDDFFYSKEPYPLSPAWNRNDNQHTKIYFKAKRELLELFTSIWQRNPDIHPLRIVVSDQEELNFFHQLSYYNITHYRVISNQNPAYQTHCKKEKEFTLKLDEEGEQKINALDIEIAIVQQNDFIESVELKYWVDRSYIPQLSTFFNKKPLIEEDTTPVLILKGKETLVQALNTRFRNKEEINLWGMFFPNLSFTFLPITRNLQNYDLVESYPKVDNRIERVYRETTESCYFYCQIGDLDRLQLDDFELEITTKNGLITKCYMTFSLPYYYLAMELHPYNILKEILLESKEEGKIPGFSGVQIKMKASDAIMKLLKGAYPVFPEKTPIEVFRQNYACCDFHNYELVSYHFRISSFDNIKE